MASHRQHAHTMLKALLLAVMIALASAARTFPSGGVDNKFVTRRALLQSDESEDADTAELGNSDEAVEEAVEEEEAQTEVSEGSSAMPCDSR